MAARRQGSGHALAARLAAVVMIAHQVGAKTTRDALFFSTLSVRKLPAVVFVSLVPTLLLTLMSPWVVRRFGPARTVCGACLTSAALHLVEWLLLALHQQVAAAVSLYLHVLLVPVLISGFWSILSEGRDLRLNRRLMRRAAESASIGGLLGAGLALAQRNALSMLPVLALFHLTCAILALRLGPASPGRAAEADPRARPLDPRGARQVLRHAPYMGWLALLVAALAMGTALLDYYFKAEVQAAFPTHAQQMRVFGLFYLGGSALAAALQLVTGPALNALGLAFTAALFPLGMAVATLGALLVRGLIPAMLARGTEPVLRNSLFRFAYEPLFNALPPGEKNAVKPFVDVGVERIGDALGYAAAGALVIAAGAWAGKLELALALLLGLAAVALLWRVHAGYVTTLRENLERGAVHIDPGSPGDLTTTTVLLETLNRPPVGGGDRAPAPDLGGQIAALGSGDRRAILSVLGAGRLPPRLVPEAIPLLGRDDVAAQAVQALRAVATPHTRLLVERLRDPVVPIAVRRRIPRVLLASASPHAVTGLFAGLVDERFEIRYQCARALARMQAAGRPLPARRRWILEQVQREVESGRLIWRAQRELEGADDPAERVLVDERLRQRADRNLEHIFNLLSLTMPEEDLREAFHALHTGDPWLIGLALEYLEAALPRRIIDRLWDLLETGARPARRSHSREDALRALQEAHPTIELRLTELHRRFGPQTPSAARPPEDDPALPRP